MKRACRYLVLIGLIPGLCAAFVTAALDVFSYGGFEVQGIGAAAVSQLAGGTYLKASVEAVLSVSLAYAVIFCVGGVFARALDFCVWGNGSTLRVLWRTLLVELGIHALWLGHASIARPQLYEAWLDGWHLRWFLELWATPLGFGIWTALAGASAIAFGYLVLEHRFHFQAMATARSRLWQRVSAAGVLVCVAAVAGWVQSSSATSTPADLALPAGLSKPPARAAGSAPKHVVFVAIDSLRSDRLLGPHATRVMPFLSELVKQRGQGFGNTVVPLARTFPSWVSILTSQHPRRHKVTTMFPRQVDRLQPPDTLPAALARHDFFTAVYSDFAGDIFGRYPFGFRDVQVPFLNFPALIQSRALESAASLLPYIENPTGRAVFPALRELAQAPDAAQLVDDCITGLERHEAGNTFSLLFFSEAHFPYAAPYPGYIRFREPGYHGPNAFQFKPAQFLKQSLAESDIKQVRGLYDAGLWSIDTQVKRLIEALEQRGLLAETLLVIAADHGENLGENQLGFAHGNHLWGVAEHQVPFIWVDFGASRPADVDRERQVSSLDIAPTLLDLLGLPPLPSFDGKSLLQAGTEPHPVLMETGLWFVERSHSTELHQSYRFPYPSVDGTTFVNANNNDEIELRDEFVPTVTFAKHLGWQHGDERLVYIPMRPEPLWQLFDTRRDPLTEHDLAGSQPERVAALRDAMLAALRSTGDVTFKDGYLYFSRTDTP
jgi:arylsulfatase A-like enzyme